MLFKEVIRQEGYSRDSYEKIKTIVLKMESIESHDFIDKVNTIVREEVDKLADNVKAIWIE